jgi:hypothetical protein
MPGPRVGDILIRNTGDMFQLTDVVTGKHIAGPFKGCMLAAAAARIRGARAIWRQHVDERGRPLGDPFKLPRE